ncbi:glutathione transferase GstA [soil metagenome]
MRLFYHAGTCSLAPHIILEEGGFTGYELEQVDQQHRWSGGDFFEVNPKGYIPTLELDDGQILTEGAAILQHLGDIAPTRGLIDEPGSIGRARQVELLTFTATELHKTFPPLWRPDTPDAQRAEGIALLRRRLGHVERGLEGREFLVDDRFSVADAYLFTVVRWVSRIDLTLDEWPRLSAYIDRVGARPGVARVVQQEEG